MAGESAAFVQIRRIQRVLWRLGGLGRRGLVGGAKTVVSRPFDKQPNQEAGGSIA